MLDRLSSYWDKSSLLQLIAPVFCVAWEAMLFSRLSFLGKSAINDASAATFWQILVLLALGCAALFVRHRWPLPVAVTEATVVALLSTLGLTTETEFLALVAVYACVARGSRKAASGGTAAILIAQLVACMYDFADPSTAIQPTALAYAMFLFPTMLTIALGIVSRLRHDRRLERQKTEEAEKLRQKELAAMVRTRDAALRRGRIAAELHDSVGHDLTAIIALAEGLSGATGDEELDRALASINELARAGLQDTRTAVRALSDTEGERAGGPQGGGLHQWDEIGTVLDNVRQLGITCALTETGARPEDPLQADLAFSLTREAVTNAVRHGRDAHDGHVSRIVASWDHGPEGGLSVVVRDDGQTHIDESDTTGTARGTGLSRLREMIALCGGTLEAGFEDAEGWTVRATIPPQQGGIRQ